MARGNQVYLRDTACSFRAVRRIHQRDPIVGTVIAVPVASGAGTVAARVFAVTSSGIVQIALSEADLR